MVYLILALLFYTSAILLGTTAARNANTNLVSGIVNTISAIIPVAISIPLFTKRTFTSQKYGILMAVLGGITIAFFTMALNKSFTQNKVGIVTPIVFGGAIFLSTILSYFFFKEKSTLLEAIGLSLLGVGLILIIYARATSK